MPRKRLTPDELNQAIVMREAGYTLVYISEQFHVSIRTLQRRFSTHKIKPGTLSPAVIAKAREELLEAAFDSSKIKGFAASLILEDLALNRLIRSKIVEVTHSLETSDHKSSTETARALASLSTSMKTTHEVMRKPLQLDRFILESDYEDLPELVVREITEEEVAEIRREQEAAAMGM